MRMNIYSFPPVSRWMWMETKHSSPLSKLWQRSIMLEFWASCTGTASVCKKRILMLVNCGCASTSVACKRIPMRKGSEFLAGREHIPMRVTQRRRQTVVAQQWLKTTPRQVLLQHPTAAFRRRRVNGYLDAKLPLAQRDSRDILQNSIGILNVEQAAQASRTRES